jgi:hypothetical protein
LQRYRRFQRSHLGRSFAHGLRFAVGFFSTLDVVQKRFWNLFIGESASTPPPTPPVFLDLFNGPAGQVLSDHVPDVFPGAFVWTDVGANLIELTGTGEAITVTSGNGRYDGVGFAQAMTFPFYLEFDIGTWSGDSTDQRIQTALTGDTFNFVDVRSDPGIWLIRFLVDGSGMQVGLPYQASGKVTVVYDVDGMRMYVDDILQGTSAVVSGLNFNTLTIQSRTGDPIAGEYSPFRRLLWDFGDPYA